jgi:hypothetical protein
MQPTTGHTHEHHVVSWKTYALIFGALCVLTAVTVLVTGWASQIESDSWQSRGVDIILPKPFLMDDVERALIEAVELLERRLEAA